MSKTLIVVRHGHAVEGDDDFARRLSERGASEVNASGKRLAGAGVRLDAVLCSSAPRASATADLLLQHCGYRGKVQHSDELYLAEPWIILRRVCETSDEVETLLVVGHNPGLSAFVTGLTGQPCELHTAQVVHLELDVNHWGEVSMI